MTATTHFLIRYERPAYNAITQGRRADLVEALEDLAGNYVWTGSPDRYVAEVVHASKDEWDWMEAYLAEHPEILDRTPTSLSAYQAKVAARQRAALDARQAEAAPLSKAAINAIKEGDFDRADTLLKQGAEIHPEGPWEHRRGVVARARRRAEEALTTAGPDATAHQRTAMRAAAGQTILEEIRGRR